MSKTRRRNRDGKQLGKYNAEHAAKGIVINDGGVGKILTLNGNDDVPLNPDDTIDLATAGAASRDGVAHFNTRQADPMRAFTVSKDTKDHFDRFRNPGESDSVVMKRILEQAIPPGRAPHGSRERSTAGDLENILEQMPSEKRMPTLFRAAVGKPATKASILNSAMSTFAAERIRGAMEAAGHSTEFLEAKADGYAEGTLAGIRHSLTEPDAIKKLDRAVATLLTLEKNGFDEAQKLRLMAGRDAHDPYAVRKVIDERLDQIDRRRQDISSEVGSIEADKEYLAVLEDVAAMVANPVLGKVTDSCFHKVVEKWRAQEVLIPIDQHGEALIDRDRCKKLAGKILEATAETGIFLLQHDWAAAFAKAKDFEGGEIQLPYAQSVFECLIGGHRVVVSIAAGSEDMLVALLHIQAQGRWALGGVYHILPGTMTPDPSNPTDMCTPLIALLVAQIRAVSIALEAEVAETEVIRAPHRLNQKRERKGQLPLYDYHVVSLANRRRYQARQALPGDIEDEHRHRRLHFVRGHWRHYSNIKTWIKWHMRGDIDLGFVDKEYRL